MPDNPIILDIQGADDLELEFEDSEGLDFEAQPFSKGDPGKSAYQVAVDNGFSGTEEEWLASLVGPRGYGIVDVVNVSGNEYEVIYEDGHTSSLIIGPDFIGKTFYVDGASGSDSNSGSSSAPFKTIQKAVDMCEYLCVNKVYINGNSTYGGFEVDNKIISFTLSSGSSISVNAYAYLGAIGISLTNNAIALIDRTLSVKLTGSNTYAIKVDNSSAFSSTKNVTVDIDSKSASRGIYVLADSYFKAVTVNALNIGTQGYGVFCSYGGKAFAENLNCGGTSSSSTIGSTGVALYYGGELTVREAYTALDQFNQAVYIFVSGNFYSNKIVIPNTAVTGIKMTGGILQAGTITNNATTPVIKSNGAVILPDDLTISADWSDITNKPTSFPPSTHTHTKSQITDFPTNVSAFVNDAGYLTSHQDISGKIDEPASEGTNGQVLTTDGNGGRSWTTVSGGGSTAWSDITGRPTLVSDISASDGALYVEKKLSDGSTLVSPVNTGAVYDAEYSSKKLKLKITGESDKDVFTATDTPTSGSSDLITSGGVYDSLASKQDALTVGDGIDITSNIISNTQGIEYIVGTQAGATNLWTGVSTDSSLKTGKIIAYYLPYAGTVYPASLNLTMADGTTTGAISLMQQGSSAVTTHYAANNIIILIYDGTYWRVSAFFDSNSDTDTIPTLFCTTAASTVKKVATCTYGYRGDDAYTPIVFRYANTAVDATLQVSQYGSEACAIYVNGARTTATNTFSAGVHLLLYHDHAYYMYNDGRFPIVVNGAVTSVQEVLNNKAALSHTHTKSEITDFPTLAAVATSGSYDDLSDAPARPSCSAFMDEITAVKTYSENNGRIIAVNKNHITVTRTASGTTFALMSLIGSGTSYQTSNISAAKVKALYDAGEFLPRDHYLYNLPDANKKWYLNVSFFRPAGSGEGGAIYVTAYDTVNESYRYLASMSIISSFVQNEAAGSYLVDFSTLTENEVIMVLYYRRSGNASYRGVAAEWDWSLESARGVFGDQDRQDSNLAWVEGTTTASRAYAVGDYVTIQGVLCKITAAVANGGTLISGTNYTTVTGGLATNLSTAIDEKADANDIEQTNWYTDGYWNTGVGTGNVVDTYNTSTGFVGIKIPVKQGDFFRIVIEQGGSSPRAWCFTNENNIILTVAADSANFDGYKQAPADGYLYCAGIKNKTRTVIKLSPANAVKQELSDKVLYFTSVACSAQTGDFASVSDALITADHVVAECAFANPEYITANVTWTTASGSVVLNGTCLSATTANLILVKKDN